MRTREGLARLLTFADAVVAIALTLLVLPLVEIAQDIPEGAELSDVLGEHRAEIGGFVLSFAVIWVLWSAHHRTMEHFDSYDPVVFRLTLLFLFTIVVLPFTTQLLTGRLYEHGAAPVYDGVLLASSLSLYGTAWWGQRHPELLHDDHPGVRQWLAQPASPITPAIVAIALVVSLFAPAVGTWPLFALVLTDRLDDLWQRVHRRRRPAVGRAGS